MGTHGAYLLGAILACGTFGSVSSHGMDGFDEDGSRKISRTPLYRLTFDLTDQPEFIDFITGIRFPISGYGGYVKRVEGRTRTSDEVLATKALYFNGKGFVRCGTFSDWNSPVHRTLAFYVKKMPGKQPRAVLCHQSGKDRDSVHVALGPIGDGTDLFAKLGHAVWEGRLTEPIREGVWTHLILTVGYGGIKVYVDTHEQPAGTKGGWIQPVGDFCIGGAPNNVGFKGAIDDLRMWNTTHQGIYFIMPRHRIELPHPELVKRTDDQWYRGKALALRITWNRYLYGSFPKQEQAGRDFDAEEIARMAVGSGACGVLMKMRAPNGFPVFPSKYMPARAVQTRDYAGELVAAVKKKGLWFAPNLSQENIDAMGRVHGMSKAESMYTLIKEIFDRYDINMYQFRFDGFWGQNETYDPADYDYQRIWELFRERHPETLINYNRFSGHGSEDMADIETSRPTDQVHYWEQEDFHELLQCRHWDWAVEVETPLGDDWGGGGVLTALPSHYLLNKISTLSAMGITTVLGFGPDNRGCFTSGQKQVLMEIGQWLVPRKPYLDNARPLHDAGIKGYDGLGYVNKVDSGMVVNLLSGSKVPVKLPRGIEVSGIGKVNSATLVPEGESLSFKQTGDGCTIDLRDVRQDSYNTMIVLK